MRVRKTVLSALIAVAGCAASTEPLLPVWILVDDFESRPLDDNWVIFDAQNDTDPFVPNPQISEVRQEPGTNNRFLLRKPAPNGIVGNRKALAWVPLPAPILVGETATIFTRINVESFPNNHAFGISNQSDEDIKALSYDAFEPMIRITDKAESDGTKNDGTLMVIIGGKDSAKIVDPKTDQSAKPLVPGKWYDLWIVINNGRTNASGQTYSLYVQGGEFTRPTLVYENAGFRIGREEPLTRFIAITNTGPARDPYGNGGVRYDDIYMAKGELTSSPLGR